MKRLLSIIILAVMLLSLSGCKRFEDMSINGVSITEYQIVCDKEGLDYDLRAAEYVRGSIEQLTGTALEIVDDAEAVGAHEIVIGKTARQISAEVNTELSGVEFSMLAKGGNVALYGNYFVVAAAAYYFVDTYVKGGDVEILDGALTRTPIVKEAKSYMLLIGDGMGKNQTLLHNYLEDTTDYSDGEDLFYGYMLPYHGYSRTDSFSGTTDSAAGGTALATGYKTLNKYVGIDKDGNELKSLTELSFELGKASAVMSTELSTGATPASFSAHSDGRNNSTDIRNDQEALTANNGTIINCRPFTQYSERYLKNNEARIVETLDTLKADKDGFFLMYEEAHIDKHCHNNDIDKTFLALLSFNQAIARFMEYAFYNPDTLVIITADHETGALLENGDGTLSYNSEEHSSANVPIFAWGYGTEFFDGKEVENIEIAHFISSAMGVDDFGDRTNGWYNEIYGGGN